MRKRTFLRLLSAVAASPTASRFSNLLAKEKLTNWAGNLAYGTDHLHEAATINQIRSVLRSQEKVKVLGSRHCFSSIADSRHILLSLKPMDEVVSLDPSARSVTVGSAMKYGQLAPYIDAKGFALHNLASLPHISISGGCSTATHGSGEQNGNLSTAVAALEMVIANGDVVKLSRHSEPNLFKGAVVGLGALGVITKVTLDIQPTYQMRQYVYQNLPLSQMKEHFDAIQASGYSVSLFTDWQKQRINEVWIKGRVENGKAFPAPLDFYGAKRAAHDLHPIAELSSQNCTEQMGVIGPWYARLPHFRMGFTPSAGKELQTEYLLPRRNAVDAILAVERLGDQIFPHLLISEIRTIAADDLWMSTSYGHPSVAIHFTWKQDWPNVKRLLPIIEKELAPYQPRPHWGKLFAMSRAELHGRYERMDEFIQLANKYDPKGKFRNDFLNANVFGGA